MRWDGEWRGGYLYFRWPWESCRCQEDTRWWCSKVILWLRRLPQPRIPDQRSFSGITECNAMQWEWILLGRKGKYWIGTLDWSTHYCTDTASTLEYKHDTWEWNAITSGIGRERGVVKIPGILDTLSQVLGVTILNWYKKKKKPFLYI